MLKKHHIFLFIILSLINGLSFVGLLSAQALLINKGLPTAKIVINHQNPTSSKSFTVEVAKSPIERQIGLMNVISMANNYGMLFIFEEEKMLSFWMKNTPLSLDIIYITANGEIISIAKNTTPNSLSSVPSIKPAQFVLEINAGLCDKLNIKIGDMIDLSQIKK